MASCKLVYKLIIYFAIFLLYFLLKLIDNPKKRLINIDEEILVRAALISSVNECVDKMRIDYADYSSLINAIFTSLCKSAISSFSEAPSVKP